MLVKEVCEECHHKYLNGWKLLDETIWQQDKKVVCPSPPDDLTWNINGDEPPPCCEYKLEQAVMENENEEQRVDEKIEQRFL